MNNYFKLKIISLFVCCCIFLSACSPSSDLDYSGLFIDDTPKADAATQRIIDTMISNEITENMSDYDKAHTIHDFLIQWIEFDEANLKSDTIPDSHYHSHGALVEKSAVCQGYAEAFYLIATQAGMECNIVTGFGRDESHAWNQIKIDGVWYNIDVTWDDPIIKGGHKTTTDNLSYEYFLLPDSEMYKDHILDKDCKAEKCTSSLYLYKEKRYHTPYFVLPSLDSMGTYYLNYYLQGNRSVTFYFPDKVDSLSSEFLNSIGAKLHSAGASVTEVHYTDIASQGIYHYTTITFE